MFETTYSQSKTKTEIKKNIKKIIKNKNNFY